MGEWKTVKLAEVLRYRKGNILINNDEEYSLCRVQLHRRGVVLREKKMGSQIKTKKQQVCRAGDLVVAEMDAKFGGYGFIPDHLDGAIVSSHYYLYELDKGKITQGFFEILIKTDFIQNQIEAKGSTNYSSIRAWEFLDYEIPLQSIALQNSIAAKYVKHSRFKEDLGIELNAQLKYLSQLRLRILQEAIEGKLTDEWRDKHPDLISGNNRASKLLEKIKAEKERLIKECKIKKDKPLAPITDAEKPFDLPEGWVWCRLGEISSVVRGGSPRPAGSIQFYEGSIPFLKVADLTADSDIYLRNYSYTIKNAGLHKTRYVEANTLMLTNSGATLGVPKICTFSTTFNDGIAAFLGLHKEMNKCFLYYFLKAKSLWFLAEAAKKQGQPNLNTDIIAFVILALPPVAEQHAIVELLEKLMTMIEDLEKQVSERKEQSEMLMQSVLREAFAR